MGYYTEYVNYYGVVLEDADEILEELDDEISKPNSLFEILLVGEFDGADSRIDNFKNVLAFKKYSKYTDNNNKKVSGDIYGMPTSEEVAEMKQLLESFGIDSSEPKREELTFIL